VRVGLRVVALPALCLTSTDCGCFREVRGAVGTGGNSRNSVCTQAKARVSEATSLKSPCTPSPGRLLMAPNSAPSMRRRSVSAADRSRGAGDEDVARGRFSFTAV